MSQNGADQIAQVRLYTISGCGACGVARRVLRRRGIEFEEVSGDGVPGFRRMLLERTGRASVPQVVIDDEPIGGADSLIALDRRGVLLRRVSRDQFPVAVVRRRFSPRRLLSGLPGGRGGGPWRYESQLVDRDGRILESAQARSREEATARAAAMRGELWA